MKTLYFECNMGAAGDMLMAALIELHENPNEFLEKLNNIGIPKVNVTYEPSVKCGIIGTHIKVTINGQEEHTHNSHTQEEHIHGGHNSYHDIEHLIGKLTISEQVKKNALSVYKLIAEAESQSHGIPVNQIHFHEVGELDALTDIVGVCMLIEELAPDLILSSPVNVGSGHVRCSHGILPVPAPATARILQNVPIYSGDIKGELCTPTGAALLKHFAKKFIQMPVISISKLGYGMGTKDFEKANCVRAYIGEAHGNDGDDEIVELVCNLDDMTPEAVAFAQQLLLDEGALDVYITQVVMKKNRAGVMITCMCRSDIKDKMIYLIFKHTSTLGIRENISRRYTLRRTQEEIKTKYGVVRIKNAYGFGIKKSKPEYEDISKIALEQKLSIRDVMKEIESD